MRWCRLLTVLCIVSQPGGNNWWEDRAGMHQGSPDIRHAGGGGSGFNQQELNVHTAKNEPSECCMCLVWRSPMYPCIRSRSWVCWLQTQRGQRGEQGPGGRAPVLGLHPHHQVHCQQGHTGARGLPCSEWDIPYGQLSAKLHYVIMSLCHCVIMSSTLGPTDYRSAFTLQTDNICNIMK